MRAIILAALVAVGVGLAGMPTVSAAPISGAAIGENVSHDGSVTKIQHWRWGSRRGGHFRWGSRGGHWRWGSRQRSRCHLRFRSAFVRC
jgi:hypothetical protein